MSDTPIMMPIVYRVKPEHVAQRDVNDYLRECISKNFAGKDYSIVNEQTLDKNTYYSRTVPRKIKAFAVNVEGESHSIFFDITEVSVFNGTSWFGNGVS